MASDTPVKANTPPAATPWPVWRYTLLLAGPLALLCLITKAHKLIAAPEGSLSSTLAALFPDLAFGLGFVAATFLLLRYAGRARPLARVALHLVTLLFTLLVFIEHGFWVKTGTQIDAYTLWYGLDQLDALGKVYLSEMGLTVWLGFAAVLGLQALPFLALRRRPIHPLTARTTLLLAGTALVAPACTGVFALVAEVPDPVLPLTGNVIAEFANDILREEAPEPAPPELDGLHGELELVVAPLPADAKKKNVIVIVLESLRASATSVYSKDLDTTPFLTTLAERGAVVDHAWPSVTHTSKALVGILCGLHPKLDAPIEEAEPTGLPVPCLAKILRERGYATAFMQTATANFERRDQLVRNMAYETFESKEALPSEGFEETSYFGWEDRALVKPALDWLAKQAEQDRPFFLTLLTLSTHHTYKTPSTFPKVKRASGELDEYLNATRYLDGVLEELFAGLEAGGHLDDTLVVLIGDHGEGFGEHGRYQHDTVIYEEGLHIPLMVVGEGVPKNTRIAGQRHAIDVVPTVLDWLGTPLASGLPGRSLLSTPGHERTFASCWLRQRCMAVREGPLKYIWHFDRQGPEVFDLVADPKEKKNLLSSLDLPTVQRLREAVLAYKADNDTLWARFFANAHRDFVTTLPPFPARPLGVTYSDKDGRPFARLIGVDGPTTATSGEPIRVTLYWEALAASGPGWKLFSHLIGHSPTARPRFNADHTPVAGRHPVIRWEPHTFISDPFRIQPEQPLPPGRYRLVVGLWDETHQGPPLEGRASPSLDPGAPGIELDADRRAHVLEIEVLPKESPADGSKIPNQPAN
ncbi:MAG TPA: LTA synthase family protein [Myxococcota bacterium]|nr:LTA synthase family protein [Myxococcota bacterium]